jgi:hypothetical protein
MNTFYRALAINNNLNYQLIKTLLCAEVSDKILQSGAGGLCSHFSMLTLFCIADKLILSGADGLCYLFPVATALC